jgi:2-isopropylmalate synthase
LDDFGFSYIEGGWPGSNPKDLEYFKRVKENPLKNAKVVAFGSTRRASSIAEEDPNLLALVNAETPAVALVGKSSTLHVEKVLETTLENNLLMISDSVRFMKRNQKEVIYDAEHFFDGYELDPEYALETLKAAADAGADWLVLCDTNGGTLPQKIFEVVQRVCQRFSVAVGIHTHNDGELAVANSLAAVQAGARQVQGTINGYGERCGNANLVSVIPNLQLKLGYQCIADGNMARLTSLSRTVSEICNLNPDQHAAYVGESAFAHKGGIHVAAVEKISKSYEHIPPEVVGNCRQIVVSELSGRGNIRVRAQELGLELNGIELEVLKKIKELEGNGYQFENAEGTFELLVRRAHPEYESPFKVVGITTFTRQRANNPMVSEAVIKVEVNGELMHVAAEGDGPVNALDQALRKSLTPHFPALEPVHLTDYKVRILDPESATNAIVRVFVEATSGMEHWTTVGCSKNIIDSSFRALADSYELFLLRMNNHGTK